MFRRLPPIFFLTETALTAARIHPHTYQIEEEKIFVLDEHGLVGALKQACSEFGQGARFVLPEEYLYVTQLEVAASGLRSRSVLEDKILEVFPETLGDFAWDYELIEMNDEKAVVEISGVVKDFGEVLRDALKNSHCRIEALIPESYALARLISGETVSLLIHERESGWICALIAKERVVTSIFLEQVPTEQDLRSLITFGTERKKAAPNEVILSLCDTDPSLFPLLDLPQRVIEGGLNPLTGAAKIVLNRQDSARLDLPLRGTGLSWFARVSRLFHRV